MVKLTAPEKKKKPPRSLLGWLWTQYDFAKRQHTKMDSYNKPLPLKANFMVVYIPSSQFLALASKALSFKGVRHS